MRRIALIVASLLVSTGAMAQTTTYYGRTKLGGMQMKATVRQLVTHPYWGCLAGQPDGFNPDWYGTMNEDVVEAGYPLYQHYVDYGKREGRLPCQASGTTTYNPGDTYTHLVPRSGSHSYTATASVDVYEAPSQMTGAVIAIDGFDVDHDKLSLAFLEQQVGPAQIVDLGGGLGTELRWNGQALFRLVGISVDDAKRIEAAGRAG